MLPFGLTYADHFLVFRGSFFYLNAKAGATINKFGGDKGRAGISVDEANVVDTAKKLGAC